MGRQKGWKKNKENRPLFSLYTYREAALLLSAEIGREEDKKWQATFEYGKATELDATMIHSQEDKGKNIAVKLGKGLESETAI